MDFLNNVNKELEKAGIESGTGEPPRSWISSGNYVLNKIVSGSFYRFLPQGRIVCLAGPSGAGKSFVSANIAREALEEGAIVIAIDSENALDDDFMRGVGVNVDSEKYMYISTSTISDCKKTVSKIVKGFEDEYGNSSEAPDVVMIIDSVDMLMSDAEMDQFKKGENKGDMGQRSKQLKSMLRSFVQAIKNLNISMVITHQVYKNQDVMNGEGLWIVGDAIKFSLSQVVLLSKLKLREKTTKETTGIRMKCEGYKTRFTKPFQTVTIEVPYDTGMDPYNGLLDVAVEIGVVKKSGSWFTFGDVKFQQKNLTDELNEKILKECEGRREKFLEALDEDYEEDDTETDSSKKKRAKAMGVEV